MKETIEIGKRFIRRNYSVVKITETKGDHFCDEFGRWYFSNGTVVKDEESPYDLMSQIFELSTLNPMKIDEERMQKEWHIIYPNDSWDNSWMKKVVAKYNSTCKDHQVLQPLPKDKPDWFEWSLDTSKYDLWDELVKTYGTPTKKELVSVEELEKDFRQIYLESDNNSNGWIKNIAQHIINTYSLNPPKREWWMDLKYGDEYFFGKIKYKFKQLRIEASNGGIMWLDMCTPYIEPSIHDKVKEKLGIELYEEFMKEVKGA